MAAAGCRLYQHYREMAYMGFAAVLRNLDKVCHNFRIAREVLRTEQPEVLILIDYPGFNLRMAAWCRRHLPKTKIVYYIPPKIWAWRTYRVHRIGRLCDLILGIFPFEESFYARYGYTCQYVGNPCTTSKTSSSSSTSHSGNDSSSSSTSHSGNASSSSSTSMTSGKSIAVLPGSRMSEVQHCLPRMLEAALRFPEYRIEVAMAPGIDESVYRSLSPALPNSAEAKITYTRETYRAVAQARVAIVNSGTATLETALIGTPQVAVYHLACSRLIGWIRPLQRYLFHIPYFTLVNILAEEELIPELIAERFTVANIEAALSRILNDAKYEKRMRSGYEHIRQSLGHQDAAQTAAQAINQMAAKR